MKRISQPLGRALLFVALVIAAFSFCTLTSAQQAEAELEVALEAIQATPPTPA